MFDHFTNVTIEELNTVSEEDMVAYHSTDLQAQADEENALIHECEMESERKWEETAQHMQACSEREWEELNIGYNGSVREYEYSYGREP